MMGRARVHLPPALLMAAFAAAVYAAPEAEAEFPLPHSARRYAVGDPIVLNGLPLRMQGFTSPQPVEEIKAWYIRVLGSPVVETRQGDTLVLGKALHRRYLTVQLEPGRSGTRGVVAVSDLEAARRDRDAPDARLDRWLRGLPADARVVSDMASIDRGRRSRHLVIENGQDEAVTSRRIAELLAEEGYVLEREALVPADESAPAISSSGEARALYFKGEGKEALATVFREPRGRTVAVINAVSAVEQFR